MNSLQGKKVLFVITKSNWGGAQSYVYALATNFAKNGADVVVALGGTGLSNAPTGFLAERLQKAGIRTVFVHSFMREVSTKNELGALTELRNILRKEEPDILHLNSSKAGGIGALAGRLEGTPKILFTAHGWAHRESRSLLAKFAIRLASWATILLSHEIIVVSKLDYEDSPVLFSRKKIFVIHNGINDFPLLDTKSARELLATKDARLSTHSTWILMETAELVKNKGVDIAIASLNLVKEKYPNTQLVVLGEGEERPALEAQVRELKLENSVFLLGFVPDSRTYLKAADMFLLSSRKEGLPIALLEAGIAELPVVATKTGGIPEVILDGETGLLAESHNPQSFALALEKFLEQPDKRISYGEKNALRIKKEFSEEKMLEQTKAMYMS